MAWTPDKMITVQRAESVALALFPDEFADGSDCHSEHGRQGLPCRVCAERNESWQKRVAEVRNAMLVAFGYAPLNDPADCDASATLYNAHERAIPNEGESP